MPTDQQVFPIDAAQAAKRVNGFVRGMNGGWNVPKLLPALQRESDRTQVYIFNVGPWSHERSLGSVGTYRVQAREKGKDYSKPLIIPGIVCEPVPTEGRSPLGREMKLVQEDGRFFAEQVLGIGQHLNKRNSMVQYGVFIAAGKEPTKEELATARGHLHEHYESLITDARSAWEKGGDEPKRVIRDTHRTAARELNLTDEPWMLQRSANARKACPSCGTMAADTVAMCPNCKYILNAERYAALKNNFAS